MNKAVVLLLGVAGLGAVGVAGGHYYLAGQTEQVYQTGLDQLNQQLADSGFPINAEKISLDGQKALTRITLPEELGDLELVFKQIITAGPLLSSDSGMEPGLYSIKTTLDKSNLPEEVVQAFQLLDDTKPLVVDTVVGFDQSITTDASMGAFVFEMTGEEKVVIEADGFELVNSSNKDQTSANGVMSFGKITSSFPGDNTKFTISGGEAQVDAADIIGSFVSDGTGTITFGTMKFEGPEVNVLIDEMLYEFSSQVKDGKIHREDEMAFSGFTIDSPLPNGKEIKNWHMNMVSNSTGFTVKDIEHLQAKTREMNRLTSSLWTNGPDSLDEEKYQKVMAEYLSAFVDTVKKDLSVATNIDFGPENTDASLDLELSYSDDLPLRDLKTIGQLVEALKFDGKAIVPTAMVENDPEAVQALQQFAMMGFVKAEEESFSGQFNLAQGKAKLNGEDFPIEMWVAGVRDMPLNFSLMQ